MFFITNDVDFARHANENKPCLIDKEVDDVKFKLENASETLFQWLSDNQMKANEGKCHLFVDLT